MSKWPKLSIVLVLFLALLSLFLLTEKKRGNTGWPKTVQEAVENILSSMSEEDKSEVKNTPREDLILYHHGWGTGIRNAFGLWADNDDLILSACGRPCHPDDASMIIIEAVWLELNKNP